MLCRDKEFTFFKLSKPIDYIRITINRVLGDKVRLAVIQIENIQLGYVIETGILIKLRKGKNGKEKDF